MPRPNAFCRPMVRFPLLLALSAGWLPLPCDSVRAQSPFEYQSPQDYGHRLTLNMCGSTVVEPPPHFVYDVKSLFRLPDPPRQSAAWATLVSNPRIAAPPPLVRPVSPEIAWRMFDIDPNSDNSRRRVSDDPAAWRARLERMGPRFVKAADAIARGDVPAGLSILEDISDDTRPAPASVLAARFLLNTEDRRWLEQARKLLDQAAIDDPAAPEPVLELARLALVDGHLSDALAQAERCVRLVETHEGLPLPVGYRNFLFRQAYAAQGNAYRRLERWDLAEHSADHRLALDVNDARAAADKAEAVYRRDSTNPTSHDEALRCFGDAYQHGIDDSRRGDSLSEQLPPEMALAALAHRLGHQETARRYAEQLEKLLPNFADDREKRRCGLFLARLRFQQNDFDGAMKAYLLAAQWSDQDLEFRKFGAELSYYLRSPDCIHQLMQLYMEMPDDPSIAGLLSRAIINYGKPLEFDRAIRLAKANLAAHPESQAARCTLAWAYYRAGRTVDATDVVAVDFDEYLRLGFPSGEIAPTTLDDAYILAKITFERPGLDHKLAAVIGWLQHAKRTAGPSRFRAEAEQWLASLTGGP